MVEVGSNTCCSCVWPCFLLVSLPEQDLDSALQASITLVLVSTPVDEQYCLSRANDTQTFSLCRFCLQTVWTRAPQGLTNCGIDWASRATGAASRLSALPTWLVGKESSVALLPVLFACWSSRRQCVCANCCWAIGECRLQPCHHPSMETMMVTKSMPRKTIRLLRYFRTSCIVPPHASFARPLTAQHTLK